MELEELRRKAEALGLEWGIFGLSKTELIRKIQRREGNPDCFGKALNDCDQFQCCFRKDCLNPRIMVVDDEEMIRDLYKDILEKDEGFVVECACNGEEALEKLPLFSPDVITLDIKMPGMDGIECLKRIRKIYHALPVILCSAYGEYKQD